MNLSLNGPGLWYVTRATGIVTLLMLTFSVFLGVATRSRRSTRRLPRFLLVGLHRNVSLMVMVLLALHVLTTVVDSYTDISLLDAFVPFLSQYRGIYLGLGALAGDALIVLVLTSVLRERIGHRTWKALHWLSYLCWPVALVHAWGTGTDPGAAWGRWIGYACVAFVAGVVGWRLVIGARPDRADTLARAGDRMTSLESVRTSPASGLPRLLDGAWSERSADLDTHLRRHGPPPLALRRDVLIETVERSGLTGRGGAGFPTARKLRSVAEAGRGPAVVVANGMEGEPASSKDRLLLTRVPHLVLDGISLAAHAVGADHAYLCVHRGEPEYADWLRDCVAERAAAGIDRVPIEVAELPRRYVASEQSSLVRFLDGGPAAPTFGPRPHERGVGGRPTLVNNVETLAHLAQIARRGDGWFRAVGAPGASGSMLTTVSGAVNRPGVYEVPAGTAVGQALLLAGGPAERPKAVLCGGYFGAWLPAEVAWNVPMTHAGMRRAGAALGAGILIALPETACVLGETARVVRYMAQETAGQCGPCVFGLPALAEAFADLAFTGGRARGIQQVRRQIELVDRRGACRHPDGVAALARSALETFADDALDHDRYGPCEGLRRPPVLPLPPRSDREETLR